MRIFQVHLNQFLHNAITYILQMGMENPKYYQQNTPKEHSPVSLLFIRNISQMWSLFIYLFIIGNEQVAALKQLTRKELIDFFNEHIKACALRKKTLSIRVYGNLHSSDKNTDESETIEPNFIRIEDIFGFRRLRPLYGSFKWRKIGHLKFVMHKNVHSEDADEKTGDFLKLHILYTKISHWWTNRFGGCYRYNNYT